MNIIYKITVKYISKSLQKEYKTPMRMKKVLLLFLLIAIFAAPAAQAATLVTANARSVVDQVNQERAKLGLSALRVDPALTAAAQIRAREIVERFSHSRPDGTKWSTVSSRAYGENIAKGQKTADKVMAAWMSSSGHRANILRANYGSIGVACVKSGNVYYWVQLFGK